MQDDHESRDLTGPEPRPPASGARRWTRTPLRPLGEPMWSPTPVLAYRLWWIRNNVVHGARTTWDVPYLDAHCPVRNDGACPHSDGRCGPLGCGIYGLKDPRRLRGWLHLRTARGWIAGLVAMSGKVVEHTYGYRAERADVVAAVVAFRGRISAGTAPDWMTDLFADPAGAADADPRAVILDPGPVDPRQAKRHALAYLDAQRPILEESWILENPRGSSPSNPNR